jgi:hypothetical protein
MGWVTFWWQLVSLRRLSAQKLPTPRPRRALAPTTQRQSVLLVQGAVGRLRGRRPALAGVIYCLPCCGWAARRAHATRALPLLADRPG